MATPPPSKDQVAAKIEREIRRSKATKMAVDGHTYQQIADALGYNSPQAAHRDVKAGLAPAAKLLREAANEYIAVQFSRLEQAHRDARAIFDEFGDGDEYSDRQDQRLAALDRMFKASTEVRKLLGLDAPTKTETKLEGAVAYQIAVSPDELEQL